MYQLGVKRVDHCHEGQFTSPHEVRDGLFTTQILLRYYPISIQELFAAVFIFYFLAHLCKIRVAKFVSSTFRMQELKKKKKLIHLHIKEF